MRLVTKLESQIETLSAQLVRNPQPLIASLAKELKLAQQTLDRKTQELIAQRQLNRPLAKEI